MSLNRVFPRPVLILIALSAVLCAALRGEVTPQEVVVVANRNTKDSIELARYYMGKRDIPRDNLIVLDAPDKETVTWTEFVDHVWNPLLKELTEREWIDAVETDRTDKAGRLRYVRAGHKIGFLVNVYGVPLRISADASLKLDHDKANPGTRFGTNQCSVDSELSLLAANDSPIAGVVRSGIFRNANPDPLTLGGVVRVSRLDSVHPTAVRDMIDSAIMGEELGLRGRAYIDKGGPHKQGNDWLDKVAEITTRLGYDTVVDDKYARFDEDTRFDAPALCFGWYTRYISGPFLRNGFRFPAGAIAIDIHSFSADTLRRHSNAPAGFTFRGAAVSVGNVYEPYLGLTHNLDAFMMGLAQGMSFGEAAYFSLPALSWQTVNIGDPLYKPFKTDLRIQISAKPDVLSQYALIRQANLLRQAGRDADALALLKENAQRAPGLAIAATIAQLAEERGEPLSPEDLKFLDEVKRIRVTDITLAAELAAELSLRGFHSQALDLYKLAIDEDLPISPSREILEAARKAALAASDRRLARRLENKLATMEDKE